MLVHAVENEYDYFTAVDDHKNADAEEDAGAGMIGTVEFNSSTLYRYATVDVDRLHDNLGDAKATRRAVEAFVRAFVLSMPTGKQNTFANRTLPDAVLVVLRETQSINLVGAFEEAVAEQPRIPAAIDRLAAHPREVQQAYGETPVAAWTFGPGSGSPRLRSSPPAGTSTPRSPGSARPSRPGWHDGAAAAAGRTVAVVGNEQPVHPTRHRPGAEQERDRRAARRCSGSAAHRRLKDLLGLTLAVRTEQPGRLERDFQTAARQGERTPVSVSTRHYLADAVFLAAVEGDRSLLEGLQEALRRPQFPLYLGRRSCPPIGRLEHGLRDGTAVEALTVEPWHAAPWFHKAWREPRVSLDLVADCDPAIRRRSWCVTNR